MRVLGVLAGQDMPLAQIGRWAESADRVLCADGGADALLALDIVPEVIVGDLDSVSDGAREMAPTFVDPDQSRSDCDKLLTHASQLGVDSLTLCAVEGDLPDHFLATLHSIASSGLTVRLALRRGLGWVLNGPSSLTLPGLIGARASVIPLDRIHGLSLHGMEWDATPETDLSLSNRVVGESARVTIASGVAFVGLFHPSLEEPTWP